MKVRRVDHRGHLWSPAKSTVICSQHFQEDAFLYQFGRKTIKPGALPTIFSFAPDIPKRKAPKCRTGSTAPTTSSSNAETISIAEHSEQSSTGSSVDKSAESSAFFSENSGGAKRVKTFHSYCTPCGVHYKLVITHLSTLCWHRTCFYYHRFFSVGAVFYFSHFLFLYSEKISDVCFVYMGFEPAIEYNE